MKFIKKQSIVTHANLRLNFIDFHLWTKKNTSYAAAEHTKTFNKQQKHRHNDNSNEMNENEQGVHS